MDSKPYKSTEPETLEQRIMDSTIAKSESEWWANREIVRLRAELDREKESIISFRGMWDKQERELATCRAELERERIRLSACGVAANQNTKESIKQRINKDNEYHSASYEDVCKAVDREIALMQQIERGWTMCLHTKYPDDKGCRICQLIDENTQLRAELEQALGLIADIQKDAGEELANERRALELACEKTPKMEFWDGSGKHYNSPDYFRQKAREK